VGRIIIATLLWSEIMGGYNTPDTMVVVVVVVEFIELCGRKTK